MQQARAEIVKMPSPRSGAEELHFPRPSLKKPLPNDKNARLRGMVLLGGAFSPFLPSEPDEWPKDCVGPKGGFPDPLGRVVARGRSSKVKSSEVEEVVAVAVVVLVELSRGSVEETFDGE